jgi:hypothetical protein
MVTLNIILYQGRRIAQTARSISQQILNSSNVILLFAFWLKTAWWFLEVAVKSPHVLSPKNLAETKKGCAKETLTDERQPPRLPSLCYIKSPGRIVGCCGNDIQLAAKAHTLSSFQLPFASRRYSSRPSISRTSPRLKVRRRQWKHFPPRLSHSLLSIPGNSLPIGFSHPSRPE